MQHLSSTAEGGEGGAAERATGVCARGDLSRRVFSVCSAQSSNTSQKPHRPPRRRPPSPRFARCREISR